MNKFSLNSPKSFFIILVLRSIVSKSNVYRNISLIPNKKSTPTLPLSLGINFNLFFLHQKQLN